MLLSVHLPKTAGTSFLETLQRQFGGRLATSYDDQPLHHSRFERRRDAVWGCIRNMRNQRYHDIDCLHGHFLPLKYRWLRTSTPRRVVTWMRDPLQRLVSHYHYWQRSYAHDTAGPLHRRMIEQQWSLEEFCLRPELRNIYSEFLWGFPLHAFDFVGITEHFEDELAFFARYILPSSDHQLSRSSSERVNANPSGRGAYDLTEKLRHTLEQYHARDISLYRRALQMRAARLDPTAP